MDSKIAVQRLRDKIPPSSAVKLSPLEALEDYADSGIPLNELPDKLEQAHQYLRGIMFKDKNAKIAVYPLGITQRGNRCWPLRFMKKADHCAAVIFTESRIYLVDSKSNDYRNIKYLTSLTSRWQGTFDGVNCARYSGQLLLALSQELNGVSLGNLTEEQLDHYILNQLTQLPRPNKREFDEIM